MISDEDRLQLIDAVLQDLRPNIQMDGGDVEFVDYRDGVVEIRLSGTCRSCSDYQDSIRSRIEERLKDAVDDINEVVVVGDA